VVQRRIVVEAPIARAFEVFTARFGDFKPPEHNLLGSPTRLELEHRNIDRHGPGWQGVRDGVDDEAGWPLYLARYTALLSPGRQD
jgi:hypothetical protein